MAAAKPTVHKLLTKVNYSNANRSKGQIKYLVKHYVGATGGAKANCQYFQTYRGASAHYFVGHNGEIWQCVEENDIAWHCGAKSYKHPSCRNSNSIGVELCVKKDKSGKWYYTEATKKAAVKLFKYLMDKYGIAADHVLRHYDVTGKICGEPDVRAGNTVWKDFKKEISKKESSETSAKKSNQLKVNGVWDSATTRRLQQIFKTIVDGVVSNQYSQYKSKNPGLTTGWEWKKKPSGNSALIKAIQKKAGATVDGHIGPKTIKAMQKYFGTVQDGNISKPSTLVKALQRWCNKQA